MAARQNKTKPKARPKRKSVNRANAAKVKKDAVVIETPQKVEVVKKSVLKRVKPLYFYLFLALLVLAGLAYLGRGLFVAVMVGSKPISRIAVVKELEKQGGKQALDSMVTKELISQEAMKRNIKVTDEDVQKEVDRISKLIEEQGQTLDAYLVMQGQTMENFKDNIMLQKQVEEILKDKISISEEETKKYFDENKATLSQTNPNPKYEDVKENIVQQLKQQKLSGEFESWLAEIRKNTPVLYFVSY